MEEQQMVVGAGPATPVVALFFSMFASLPEAKGTIFVVPARSVKHAGGVQSTETNLFGRTGRPLNDEERNQGIQEIHLARIPVVFAAGLGTRIRHLTLEQLEKIMRGEIRNWREVGGTNSVIKLVGREPAEVVFSALRQAYPFMANPFFSIVLERDHQVVNFMSSAEGAHALAFGAAGNFPQERLIYIEGFNLGLNVGLAYAHKNRDNPLVKVARDFANSPDWHQALRKTGYLAAD